MEMDEAISPPLSSASNHLRPMPFPGMGAACAEVQPSDVLEFLYPQSAPVNRLQVPSFHLCTPCQNVP